MEWVYRYMVGIDALKDYPGYKRFAIHPYPGGDITYARAAIETVRGRIECGWAIKADDQNKKVSSSIKRKR